MSWAERSDRILTELGLPFTSQRYAAGHLLNAETIGWMKPGAFLINTGRGPLIDEAALMKVLQEGRIAGAAMDVGRAPDQMPSPELAQLPNVIATPHLGYMEHDQMNNYFSDNFKRVLAFAAGKPYGVINPAALELLETVEAVEIKR